MDRNIFIDKLPVNAVNLKKEQNNTLPRNWEEKVEIQRYTHINVYKLNSIKVKKKTNKIIYK